MAWIELHQSLPTHRKTLALADELDIDPVQAVGHLTCLWLWALDNAPDGDLSGVSSDKTIARAAQWKRDPKKLVEALQHCGFLDNGHVIHDWENYAGRLLDRRKRDAERKRTERGHPPDVPPPSNGHPPDNHRTSVASRAHITVHNSTVPNRNPSTADAVGPPCAEFSETERETIDAVCLALAEFGFSLAPRLWRKVLTDYPGVDLEAEAYKQADWLKHNRVKSCSAARYTNWLDKAHPKVVQLGQPRRIIDRTGIAN